MALSQGLICTKRVHLGLSYETTIIHKLMNLQVRELGVARQQATLAAEGLRQCEDELQRLQTQWAVDRAEIQVTEEELGRGSWATVSVATFRGARVAAKVIHNQILSQHNIQLFRREMDMAARIRHPNLLQFIGATQEGEMVILTELMPTSLRRELERDYFTPIGKPLPYVWM